MITTIEIDGGHKDAKVRRALHGIECRIRRGNEVYSIAVHTRNAWSAIGNLMAEGLLPA